MPICVFTLLCGWEMVFWTLWAQDADWNRWFWSALAITGVAGFPFLFLLTSSFSFGNMMKRSIEITDEGVASSWSKYGTVPWSSIGSLHLAENSASSTRCCLVVQHAGFRRGKPIPLKRSKSGKRSNAQFRFRFLIENPDQTKLFCDEMARTQQENKAIPILQRKPASPVRLLWLYVTMLGIFLFLNGAPLLFGGLERRYKTTPKTVMQNLGTQPGKNATKFFVQHFHSAKEFNSFCIVAGAMFTGVGLTLIIVPIFVEKQFGAATQLAAN
ncbi:MAG TPA: hypothetical protein VGO67_21195 [Verrucomicrobiae bacterium]